MRSHNRRKKQGKLPKDRWQKTISDLLNLIKSKYFDRGQTIVLEISNFDDIKAIKPIFRKLYKNNIASPATNMIQIDNNYLCFHTVGGQYDDKNIYKVDLTR